MNANEIRQQFLDFFASKAHTIVPSSPVVPHDDPTLMFANAGMNQFKPIFLGTVDPNSEFGRLTRAANTQKCIRAGGKHNDLDDVGQDTYHHTFFEMLGNWSFGDYFKKEAIQWAWELLTEVWGIDKNRLHATYFEGDTAEGLEPDSEAAKLWRTVTDIDPSHIHPGNKKDNFWEMGDTGPCGPCSEIHVDLTPDMSGANLVNAGDARVIELWNLVFIQFNRAGARKLSPLPAKHVDTGMGFERLCAMLQGQATGRMGQVSNYDTDVFVPIFKAIQKRTDAPDYNATLSSTTRWQSGAQVMVDISYRVIADHIRCLTFALTDGAMPSNDGRGYVLRRILRRAVRYGRQYLDMQEPFLCDLVEPVANHMASAFPELKEAHGGKNIQHVAEIIRDEEESFLRTLERGIKLFEHEAERAAYNFTAEREFMAGEAMGMPGTRIPIAKEQPDPVVIPAGVAFILHDTYGFPIDLTILMAQERGMEVDEVGYERLMDEARRKSRGERTNPWTLLASNFADQDFSQTRFVGYDRLETNARITQIVQLDLYRSSSGGAAFGGLISMGQRGAVVLEETPFYAEKGGQVADAGIIETPSGKFRVEEVHDFNGVVAHIGRCIDGDVWHYSVEEVNSSSTFLPGTELARASVDSSRRIPTQNNHTATHLLNWALREVLCDADERGRPHVQQKGSLVDAEKTRFDFSHSKPMGDGEIGRVEALVNERIEEGLTVDTNGDESVDQAAARKINTLRAVFGEKYPDKVRVVSIGPSVQEMLADPENEKWMGYSVEFCGGTHVANTREIERFVITTEEAVAKGIRRVVGVTGETAEQAVSVGEALLAEIGAMAEGQADADLPAKLAALQKKLADAVIPVTVRHQVVARLADLQKEAKKIGKQQAAASGDAVKDRVAELLAGSETIGDVTVVVGDVPSAGADALRGAIDWVRNKTPASAVLLATESGGKVVLIAGMSKDVVAKGVKAGDLIKELAPLVGGRGGGRPDMAQGGGSDASGIPAAVERAAVWIGERLS